MHVIVGSNRPGVARVYVRVVLLLTELFGHGPAAGATIEVRPIPAAQGKLL